MRTDHPRHSAPRRLFRWPLRILAGLLVLLLLVLAGAYFYAGASLPQTRGTATVEGPEGPIEVLRDRRGLVTIRAGSRADAAFGLGWVHAQDRLGQMMLTRRLGQGRLSEVVGPATLGIDRVMRTLGLARRAQAALAHLRPETLAVLDAYAAGVNALLDGNRPLPAEFLFLGQPEPWRPADSLLWGKLMALRLSGNWEQELRNARLATLLSPADRAVLFPELPADSATTLPDGLRAAIGGRSLLEVLPPGLRPALASNIWAVAGERTASGKPLLANDPHLSFEAPILWHLVRIETPEGVVAGAGSPGVPAVLIGHNGRIAWGLTTTHSDTQDLVAERLVAGDPGRYVTPDGPRAFDTREEVIAVRGGEPERLTVREGRFGPVVSDLPNAAAGTTAGTVLTLAWPALADDDTSADALVAINHAADWPAFTAALERWVAPQQNIFYADTAGHIGFYTPGRTPIRVIGDGSVPLAGETLPQVWSGFIPFAELPHRLDPPGGLLVNANNRIVGPGYPYLLATDWEVPYRAERIEAVLGDRQGLTAQDMVDLQHDALSEAARDLLPLMLPTAPLEGIEARARALLAAWDYRMDRDRPEPLLFQAWLFHLQDRLVAPLGAAAKDLPRWNPPAVKAVLTEHRDWCGRTGEDCPALLKRSLSLALAELAPPGSGAAGDLSQLRWGDRHRVHLASPLFGRIPGLAWATTTVLPTDGGNYTVNRATPSASWETRYRDVHGAGLRAVFDLADLDASRFVIAGGQSGHPLSPHWADLAEAWRDGGTVRLVAPAEAEADRLVLQPRQ